MTEKQKEYYKKNRERIKENNLNYYYNNKEKILLYQKKRCKKLIKNKQSHYYIRHLKTPRIRKEKCDICGGTNNLNRHHWDYNQPKKINILCEFCHITQHKKIYY